MKILSIQPGSLYQNGGAPRVLRRLYHDKESQVVSIGVIMDPTPIIVGNLKETLIPAIPLQKKWMRWHVRTIATWLRNNVFRNATINKIRKTAIATSYDVMHLVSHGQFSSILNDNTLLSGKKLWVSFHDHFSTNGCSFDETNDLWNKADRRLVISEELGKEYQRLFGDIEFELITDGVSQDEISKPLENSISPISTIYFAGLLHIDYYPLFKVLANALDLLSEKGFTFKLILRGTQQVEFLNNRLFEVEYRSGFVSDEEIKLEIDSASILYLPIKFTLPDFYLYSLSTKMIGYLGASGSILYHGPDDSAACNLLQKTNAAVCCTSLDVNELKECILLLMNNKNEHSTNAKNVAREQFNYNEIQKRFWQGNINN